MTRSPRSRAQPSRSECRGARSIPQATAAVSPQPPPEATGTPAPTADLTPAPAATPAPTPVMTPAPQPTPAPTPAHQPPTATPEPTAVVVALGQPDDAVAAFYREAAAGNFDAAYALWSGRMKATYPRDENLDGRFAKTELVSFDALHTVERTATSATVQANFTESYEGGGSRQFIGYWRLSPGRGSLGPRRAALLGWRERRRTATPVSVWASRSGLPTGRRRTPPCRSSPWPDRLNRITRSSPASRASSASSIAARMACDDSGAGMMPSVRANWTAASKQAFWAYALASMKPWLVQVADHRRHAVVAQAPGMDRRRPEVVAERVHLQQRRHCQPCRRSRTGTRPASGWGTTPARPPGSVSSSRP